MNGGALIKAHLYEVLILTCWVAGLSGLAHRAAAGASVSVPIGQSVIALVGPWKFRLGDNPRWADTDFNDSAWESVDLTPAPGAHDSNVGLTGYVPGWFARGHAGYSGYAWYRLRIAVSAPPETPLALAGPPDVDSAYQVFFDGKLLGGDGDFSTKVPTVYSIQPRVFSLPIKPGQPSDGTDVVAIRVWMGVDTADDSPDMGGIHIAPGLGERGAIEALYQGQWLQTIRGYVVDLLGPMLFVLLALMAWSVSKLDRDRSSSYRWLIAALLLIAVRRANQVVYFWAQWESVHTFDWVTSAVLTPLGIAASIMACFAWLSDRPSSRLPKVLAALTLLYIACQCLTRPTMIALLPRAFTHGSQVLAPYVRLLFLLLLALIVWRALRTNSGRVCYVLAPIVLVAVGLFAEELTEVGVPGIWFPWGTGVSRTQYAYAILAFVLFVLLLGRFVRVEKILRAT